MMVAGAVLAGPARAQEATSRPATMTRSAAEAWRESISAPTESSDAPAADEASDKLSAALKRLREAREAAKRRTKPAVERVIGPIHTQGLPGKADTSATTQPAQSSEDLKARHDAMIAERNANARRAGIDPKWLHQLETAPREGVSDPAALADALYAGGHIDAAFVYYDIAWRRNDPECDQAWLLLQMGNCRQQTDPAKARGFYRQLLADHPESRWSAAAGTQDKLLEWKQMDQPQQVLADVDEIIRREQARQERLRSGMRSTDPTTQPSKN